MGRQIGRRGGRNAAPAGRAADPPPRARPGKETDFIFSPFLTGHSLPSAWLLGSFKRRSGARKRVLAQRWE